MLFDQCIVVALVIKVQLSLWLWNRFQAYVNLQFGITCNSGLNVRNLKKEILGLVQAHSFSFITVGHQLKNGAPRWI